MKLPFGLAWYARRGFPLGPFTLNTTQNGPSSLTFKIGRLKWNSLTGWSFDTPGPGGVKQRGRPRGGRVQDVINQFRAGGRR